MEWLIKLTSHDFGILMLRLTILTGYCFIFVLAFVAALLGIISDKPKRKETDSVASSLLRKD